MNIDERIELLRLARDLGLKPRDLSELFGIDETQVKKWLEMNDDHQRRHDRAGPVPLTLPDVGTGTEGHRGRVKRIRPPPDTGRRTINVKHVSRTN